MRVLLVTYDVQKTNPDPHGVIRSESHNFGWYATWDDYKGVHSKLPNTTFIGSFNDLNSAIEAFYNLINRARTLNSGVLNLEKHLVCEMSQWIFASNEKAF